MLTKNDQNGIDGLLGVGFNFAPFCFEKGLWVDDGARSVGLPEAVLESDDLPCALIICSRWTCPWLGCALTRS